MSTSEDACSGAAKEVECILNIRINRPQSQDQGPMPSVSPEILRWAREISGLSISDAAKKLQLHESATMSASAKLMQLEAGEKPPSRPLLKKMSDVYRQPILTFYLGKPPKVESRGEDYRASIDDVDTQQRAIVDFLVRDIRTKQQIIKSIMDDEIGPEESRPYGSLRMQEGIEAAREAIVAATGIRIEEYRKRPNQSKAFSYLREAVENIGIFVVLAGNLGSYHTNVDTRVFRGFALSDRVTPFIVINENDAKTAWSTTLLHELTHIFLGDTGISGSGTTSNIEAFCDAVASSILISDVEISRNFENMQDDGLPSIIDVVDSFSATFKVGSTMLSYRLLKLEKISPSQYRQLEDYFYKRWQEIRRKDKEAARTSDGGPSSYVLKRYRLGKLLLETTQRLLDSKDLTTTSAAKVLGVRPLKVGDLLGAGTRT